MKKSIVFCAGVLLFTCVYFLANTAAQEKTLDAEKIVTAIKESRKNVEDFFATIIQQNNMGRMNMELSGPVYFKNPNKFRLEFDIIGMDGGYNMKSLAVFNGSIVWQAQISPKGKVLNVIKSELDENTPMGKGMNRQMRIDPWSQFEQVNEEYDITSIKEEKIDNRQVYVLQMQIKEKAKNEMTRMMEAYGNTEQINFVPEKVVFYWDKEGGYGQKFEVFNTQGVLVSGVVYKDVRINSGLKEELFQYAPPEGVNVIDMAKMMEKMKQGTQEEEKQDAMVGKACPDFSLADLNGKKFESSNLQGKISIIDFWASWCPPCLKELPLIEKVHQNLKGDNEVQLLTITDDDKQKATDFIKENKYTFPVLIDEGGSVSRSFGIDSIPRVFVIGKDGKIEAVYIGYHEDIEDTLAKDIEKLKK